MMFAMEWNNYYAQQLANFDLGSLTENTECKVYGRRVINKENSDAKYNNRRLDTKQIFLRWKFKIGEFKAILIFKNCS